MKIKIVSFKISRLKTLTKFLTYLNSNTSKYYLAINPTMQDSHSEE